MVCFGLFRVIWGEIGFRTGFWEGWLSSIYRRENCPLAVHFMSNGAPVWIRTHEGLRHGITLTIA